MNRKTSLILVTLLLGVFMGALDIFIVVPALSAIQSGLHISDRLVTWTLTSYTLVLVISQPFISKLSDMYGRRWIYVSCVAIFAIGSLLCAISPSFPLFIGGRIIQAIGAGGVIPVANAVVADVFPAHRRGAALGIVGSFFGLAFIIGPILGTVLTSGQHIGPIITDWHAIFTVNLPLAALIIILGVQVLPVHSPGTRIRLPFDWNGAALLAIALLLLILGLSQINFTSFAANLRNESALPLVMLGLAMFVPFWINEHLVSDPLIDPYVFSRRQIVIALALNIIAGVTTSSIAFAPRLIENTLHLPANHGGVYLVAVAVMLTFGTPTVGRLIDRSGPRNVLILGSAVTAVAFSLLIASGGSQFWIIIALLLIGFGLSTFVGTPLRYIVVNEVPASQRAASLSVLSICNSIGQTIILPLGGALLSSRLASVAPADVAERRLITIGAIHTYYGIVILIVFGAILLALALQPVVYVLREPGSGTKSSQETPAQHMQEPMATANL